jgi:hypothetical protein
MHDVEQAIRERAYHLWVAEGRQDGNQLVHWLTAQREILASSPGSLGSVSTANTQVKKTKKTSSKRAKAA